MSSRRKLAVALDAPLGETDDLPLILIWGGSQGSRSINQATWATLPEAAA